MDYPVDQFVADYQAALESARSADLADVVSGKALREPFEAQYSGEILDERILAFQRVMQAIDRHRKPMADLGYVRLGSDSRVNWMHRNLVRAFHRLLIEQKKRNLSIDEIKQTMEFFTSRN